ncbi:MAG: dihydroneopterin aldolase [Anaerolineae bacterium]
MDRIILQGIQFYGYHGCSEEERRVGGRYVVDVELTCDLRAAGRSDDLTDTIDYSAVYSLVAEMGRSRSFHLIEALAQAMAEAILERFPVEEVLIRVRKQPPPVAGILDYAGVEIRRRR